MKMYALKTSNQKRDIRVCYVSFECCRMRAKMFEGGFHDVPYRIQRCPLSHFHMRNQHRMHGYASLVVLCRYPRYSICKKCVFGDLPSVYMMVVGG